jgi:hypothetical protein
LSRLSCVCPGRRIRGEGYRRLARVQSVTCKKKGVTELLTRNLKDQTLAHCALVVARQAASRLQT